MQPGDTIHVKIGEDKYLDGRILNVKEAFSIVAKWKYGQGYAKEFQDVIRSWRFKIRW